MAGVAAIVRWQWVAYWRRFRRQSTSTVGNQGVALVLAGLIFFKYLQLLRTIGPELSRGKTSALESTLLVIFLAWLYPAMGNAMLIPSRRLLQLPLSSGHLLLIRMITLFIPAHSWLVVVASLALFSPLISAPHALQTVAATILFIILAYFAGLAVSTLLLNFRGRSLVLLTLLLIAVGVGPILLVSGPAGSRRFMALSPARLVANTVVAANSWRSLLLLGVPALLAAWLAAWSFRRSLLADSSSGSRLPVFRPPTLPGRFGLLVTKDLRQYRRLIDPYLGFLLAAMCGSYLVKSEAPAPELFWMFMILFYALNATLAFNCFGLDEPAGFDRYQVLPLSGSMIILSKNLMFITITGVQMLALVALGAPRFGVVVSLLNIMEATILVLAYMAWGNWMSVRYPVKLQVFRVASGGPMVETMMGLCLASGPAIFCLYFLFARRSGVAWKLAPIMLICLAVWFASTMRSGKYFERKSDEIRVLLA